MGQLISKMLKGRKRGLVQGCGMGYSGIGHGAFLNVGSIVIVAGGALIPACYTLISHCSPCCTWAFAALDDTSVLKNGCQLLFAPIRSRALLSQQFLLISKLFALGRQKIKKGENPTHLPDLAYKHWPNGFAMLRSRLSLAIPQTARLSAQSLLWGSYK